MSLNLFSVLVPLQTRVSLAVPAETNHATRLVYGLYSALSRIVCIGWCDTADITPLCPPTQHQRGFLLVSRAEVFMEGVLMF